MCKMSESRRCMMMNFDGLSVEDDDEFFESRDRMSNVRLSNVVSIRFPSRGGNKDEDFDDGRFSFCSAVDDGDASRDLRSVSLAPEDFRNVSFAVASSPVQDYNIWMAEPGSIQDRRQCLLQGMGLMSRKELMKIASGQLKPPAAAPSNDSQDDDDDAKKEASPSSSPSRSPTIKALTRSKSEGSIVSAYVDVKQREETFMDAEAKKHLLRLFSLPTSKSDSNLKVRASTIKPSRMKSKGRTKTIGRMVSLNNSVGGALLIKNLDTGKVFLIKEDGTASSLSDLQTGKQLTMEEFEKTAGHSPIVKELMRRANKDGAGNDHASEKKSAIANISKRFSSSKKKVGGGGGTPAWLKNIRGVANSINGLMGDKDKELPPVPQQSNANTSKWTRVHQHGKSYKEMSGLYMCQEIQAHEGSIWTIRFSVDAKYLASAGEDRVIHIWEVVDCDVFSANKAADEATSTPQHPLADAPPPLAEAPLTASERRKRVKDSSGSKKSRGIPDHITVPDTVFSLSDKPICSFQGHQDDVLDLSWSKSQQLLSSSMDKTVRLWDMESKACLKLFAHNDYVTCIQFNPIDDTYFISGSLDEKVRIWSIPDRKVVDWTDLHEMVTAVCYTPDGQGAIVGSHKGTCRMYDLSECKLNQKNELDLQNKKKAAQGKKITGLQFAPGSNTEVLITAADSRIRILDGPDMVYKFRGFRNTNSQIAAAFSADGKFVISASEDSQVFIWKHDEANGKTKTLINCQSYERFHCREVSVAIPWPGTIKFDHSLLSPKSKGHAKKNSMSDSVKGPSTAKGLPPLPTKTGNSDRTPTSSCTEEELSSIAPTESGNEDNASSSPAATSTSFADGDSSSSSISSSSESSSALSWLFDGSSSGRNNLQSTAAWGLVFVTAGLGGELRVYQNFGLPVRGRQASLFASGPLGGSVNKRFL